MNIDVISREMIKPRLSHPKPFKLCLLDQFTPTFYSPSIAFYPKISNDTNPTNNGLIRSAELKRSLSQTLSTLYPFSGRVHDNMFIDNYEEGVPYTETRVTGSLLDFLHQHPLQLEELLNSLLPCRPYSLNPNPESAPLVSVQTNVFDCGGIALGVCFSHKIGDATSAKAFLESWSANSRGCSCNQKDVNIDFSKASLYFPPVAPSLAQTGLTFWEKSLFREGNYTTRRFVFDARAIATLRAKARSEGVVNPSRTEALSSFIWKSCMEASSSTPSPKPSLSAHTVNIRHITKPSLPRYSVGNHWMIRLAMSDATNNIAGVELSDLAASIRETFRSVNSDCVGAFRGSEGFGVAMEDLGRLEGLCLDNPKLIFFTSWLGFRYKDIDFGWGKPVWVAVTGEVGPASTNLVRLKETGSRHEIEAWITLEEPLMSLLEYDPEFLAFATPNPSIF